MNCMRMIKTLFRNDLIKLTFKNINNNKKGHIIKKLPPISPCFLKIPYEDQYECRDFQRK